MRKPAFLSSLCVAIAMMFLLAPSTFAQRGGGGHGGGGGGFHGGGGGGFHGGGFAGGGFHGGSMGFRGGGMGFRGGSPYGYGGMRYGGYRAGMNPAWRGGPGWRGGVPGWRGANWGRGRGWGFRFRGFPFRGFGWPYWWWGYPWGWYSPWWGYPPYDNSYDCQPGYPCPYGNGGNGYDPPGDPPPAPNTYGPPNPGRTPAPAGPDPTNYMSNDPTTSYDPRPVISVDRITATTSAYREVQPAVQRTTTGTTQKTRVRPEMQNAMAHLREMPPSVREREIRTGRYSHFSPKERAYLLNAKY